MCEPALNTVSATQEMTDTAAEFLLQGSFLSGNPSPLMTARPFYVHLYAQSVSSLTMCPSPVRKRISIKEPALYSGPH